MRLGRALETVYACDEIVVVDHGSRDGTVRVAREYGARVVDARPQASPADYRLLAKAGSVNAKVTSSGLVESAWILCLDPRESLTEKVAALENQVVRANVARASASLLSSAIRGS